MKTILTLVMTGCLAIALVAAQSRTAADQYQEALRLEEVKGDLKGAIEQYKKLAQGSDRAIAARALVRMAECYEKLGQSDARSAYERVVRDFADQLESVAFARARLAALARDRQGKAVGTAGMASRQVWTPGPRHNVTGQISPDGRYIGYNEDGSGDLFLRDLVTGTDRRLTDRGEWAEAAAFSRDGKQLAFTVDEAKLSVLELNGAGLPLARLVFERADVNGICSMGCVDWSPDAKWIALSLRLKNATIQIGLLTVADGSLRVLKSFVNAPTRMLVSPDGRYLAYSLPVSGARRDVFVLATDGSGEIPIVADPANDTFMGWSPDGRHILFASDRATGSTSLWSVGFADGKTQGRPRLVKPDIGTAQSLGVTDSGSLYVVMDPNREDWDIRLASFDFVKAQLSTPLIPVTGVAGLKRLPDWSPDGKYLAYQSKRPEAPATLVIRSVETGQLRELAFVSNSTMYWSPDGRSFVASGVDFKGRSGIHRIDAQTGEVSPIVTQADCKTCSWRDPEWSPDGKSVYYARRTSTTTNDTAFVVRDLASGTERELIGRADLGTLNLSPDGRHLATTAGGVILLIPTASGEPRVMRGGTAVLAWTPDSRSVLILSGSGRQAAMWWVPLEGQARRLDFDISDIRGPIRVHPDGRQIAMTVSSQASTRPPEIWAIENFVPVLTSNPPANPAGRDVQLAWFDRTGKQIETVGAPGGFRGPALSPDGKRLAIHDHDGNSGDIWIFDAGRGAASRLTSDADGTQNNSMPLWSSDGSRIVFGSFRGGRFGLYAKRADAAGPEELLVESGYPATPMSWSPDGRLIVYTVRDASHANLWVLPLSGDRKPYRFTVGPLSESHGQISPDGKWIAYASPETGRSEVYVRPFPDGSGKWRVSATGGNFPRWRADGKELFFMSATSSGKVMAVDIRIAGSSVEPGTPRALFDSGYDNNAGGRSIGHWHTYAVSADGQRFLIPRPAPVLPPR